ncbi:tRNA (adenosine(37)-N6)-dimethylallyltransferase MiaA [Candidatus Nomurabacteria bacterium]|nr:tRNA (adenosine(37)-N6)-dimethylallyltransferase MiaA [Candidatus Nomurabacteria bacterium]
MSKQVLVIVGPTASGKSALAVQLAKKFDGEIISADSRQVYRGLDIGSGKITEKEKRGIPHHLLDIASPKRIFTVARYQKLAKQKIAEIIGRGKLPIICGGTGFYIQAIVDDLALPKVKPDSRLRKSLAQKTVPELFKMLQKLDSNRARKIDRNNPRRLIRAIEIAKHGPKK